MSIFPFSLTWIITVSWFLFPKKIISSQNHFWKTYFGFLGIFVFPSNMIFSGFDRVWSLFHLVERDLLYLFPHLLWVSAFISTLFVTFTWIWLIWILLVCIISGWSCIFSQAIRTWSFAFNSWADGNRSRNVWSCM